jgi:hypothetical protein
MTLLPPQGPDPRYKGPDGEDLPYWWDAAKGKLFRPDSAQQEVIANGTACGFRLRTVANLWAKSAGLTPQESISLVKYPVDYYPDRFVDGGDPEEPVRTPITEATMHYGVEDFPILAWAVSPTGGSAVVVVDALEKSDSPYGDCKVIQGTPGEVLPLEIRQKMGLS